VLYFKRFVVVKHAKITEVCIRVFLIISDSEKFYYARKKWIYRISMLVKKEQDDESWKKNEMSW
jgi:hypothetical protein